MGYTIKNSPESAMDVNVSKLETVPIKRILDRKSLNVVGLLYEWNTGEIIPMWKNGWRENVVLNKVAAIDG